MERIIYHGSSQIVRNPVFGSGSSFNDYGLGFYCCENAGIASEWAVSRHANGFVNKYRMETSGLRIINLNNPEYCILHWLSVLLAYREFDAGSSLVFRARDYIRTEFSVDYQNCDCIIGFRADNSNFLFAQSFLDGRLSYREFNDAVRLGDTGRQFVLKSNRAFDRITFDSYSVAKSADSYPAAVRRDITARRRVRIGSSDEADSLKLHFSDRAFSGSSSAHAAGESAKRRHSKAAGTRTESKPLQSASNDDAESRKMQTAISHITGKFSQTAGTDLFITDIVDDNIRLYDKRLQI